VVLGRLGVLDVVGRWSPRGPAAYPDLPSPTS
jgi:hypothetical protein